MYYSEELIDGVLCWRSNPRDEYQAYTSKELSAMVMRRDEEIKKAEEYKKSLKLFLED